MYSIHAQQTLVDEVGAYSETRFKINFNIGGVSTYSFTAQAYDDAFTIVSAVNAAVAGVTFQINTSGYVVATSILAWKPELSITPVIYNNVWAMLGYDVTDTYSYAVSHTATRRPHTTIWLDTIGDTGIDGMSVVAQQAVGMHGGVKQVVLNSITTRSLRHDYVTGDQRLNVEAWYGLAKNGAKITLYNATTEIGEYYLAQRSLSGLKSILERNSMQSERYSLRLELIEA